MVSGRDRVHMRAGGKHLRTSERIAGALHDEGRHTGTEQLVPAVDVLARRLPWERQRHHRIRTHIGRSAAGHASPTAPPSGDEYGGCVGLAQLVDHDPEHRVKCLRRRRRATTGDSIGLLNSSDSPAGLHHRVRHRDEIRCVDAAAGSVPKHQQPRSVARFRDTGHAVLAADISRDPAQRWVPSLSMLAYDPLGGAPAVTAAPGAVSSPAYQRFYAEVTTAQLRQWLPAESWLMLDLSGGQARFAEVAAAAGHQVMHVVEPTAERPAALQGVTLVEADPTDLGWATDDSFDAVLAEGRALSHCLATEHALDDVARVLRPGGRLLLCVDSLLAGMARLADQQLWAELADVPLADVVLVPGEGGTITRCFWPEELRSMLVDSGFEVEWVRPRTVLSADAVERALKADPSQLSRLVHAETVLAQEREGDAHGVHLVASARLPVAG